MRTERAEYFSEGIRVRGLLRLPNTAAGDPLPALVHGPGWLGLADARSHEPWHEGFTRAGYAVLAFDYRGFGESDGERGWIRAEWQLEDWLNAVTYLQTRSEIDPRRIGAYGMGGTGGGNAVMAAAADNRIRCVAAQTVVADGADWLRRMRREYEWVEFLRRLEADRRRWVLEGEGERVHPRQDLMVATPERDQVGYKTDVDSRMEPEFYLRSAESIMRYRPVDFVHRIAPRALLLTCVEHDAVTPEEHAIALYERAGAPKKLIRQSQTTHYRSYTENYPLLLVQIVDWYDRYLDTAPVMTRELASVEEVVHLRHPPAAAAFDGC
jgi:uncharacterized protein